MYLSACMKLQMIHWFLAKVRCISGGTAIEYALILAFIATAIIVAVSDTGQGVSSPFASAGNSMDSAAR